MTFCNIDSTEIKQLKSKERRNSPINNEQYVCVCDDLCDSAMSMRIYGRDWWNMNNQVVVSLPVPAATGGQRTNVF